MLVCSLILLDISTRCVPGQRVRTQRDAYIGILTLTAPSANQQAVRATQRGAYQVIGCERNAVRTSGFLTEKNGEKRKRVSVWCVRERPSLVGLKDSWD